VLLDIMMPGLSGYDVCRRIRADAQTALLPVVLVTSLDPQSERVKGIEAGAERAAIGKERHERRGMWGVGRGGVT